MVKTSEVFAVSQLRAPDKCKESSEGGSLCPAPPQRRGGTQEIPRSFHAEHLPSLSNEVDQGTKGKQMQRACLKVLFFQEAY